MLNVSLHLVSVVLYKNSVFKMITQFCLITIELSIVKEKEILKFKYYARFGCTENFGRKGN